MLDPSLLRGEAAKVAANLGQRGFQYDAEKFAKLDGELHALRTREEAARAKRNSLAKQIGALRGQGKENDAQYLQIEAGVIGDEVSVLHTKVSAAQERFRDFMLSLPNLLDADVPVGTTASDNRELRKVGTPTQFNFTPRDHVLLGELHGLLDFDTASKMARSRFVVLAGSFARLHRALAQYMLDLHVNKHGYQEQYVPYLVNTRALINTGQLPKFGTDDELFSANAEDLHLIPTAEVSLGNLAAGKTYTTAELPQLLVAHSPCFRREAGSYGKDTRGMLRQHQFDKVEMVQVVAAATSSTALAELVGHAEAVLQGLELPYRVVDLCSGDIGAAAARTLDLEVWLPGQDTYREISSCSNDRDYQARRMGARVRGADKKTQFVHLLNGSGVAVGRALIAVLENYQLEDGSIRVPKALQRYADGLAVIAAPV